MRFLSIYKTVERNGPPSSDEMAKMGALIDEAMKAGWLISTEGCLPSALGARVSRSKGKVTVTDGPFTEAKEVVGGFAILEADSKEHAVHPTVFLAFRGVLASDAHERNGANKGPTQCGRLLRGESCFGVPPCC